MPGNLKLFSRKRENDFAYILRGEEVPPPEVKQEPDFGKFLYPEKAVVTLCATYDKIVIEWKHPPDPDGILLTKPTTLLKRGKGTGVAFLTHTMGIPLPMITTIDKRKKADRGKR